MINVLQKKLIPLAIAAVAITPSMLAADEITLTSADQTVKLRGEFAGFSNYAYIIVYKGHELHVPAGLMTCEGADCLVFEPDTQRVVMASGDSWVTN